MQLRHLAVLCTCMVVLASCNLKVSEPAYSGYVYSLCNDSSEGRNCPVKALPHVYMGGLKEKRFMHLCLTNDEVNMDSLRKFVEDGGRINAFVTLDHDYKELKFAATIPIVKWFVANPYKTNTVTYITNPLCVCLLTSYKNPGDVIPFLLKNDAKCNVQDPSGRYPIDYLCKKNKFRPEDTSKIFRGWIR